MRTTFLVDGLAWLRHLAGRLFRGALDVGPVATEEVAPHDHGPVPHRLLANLPKTCKRVGFVAGAVLLRRLVLSALRPPRLAQRWRRHRVLRGQL